MRACLAVCACVRAWLCVHALPFQMHVIAYNIDLYPNITAALKGVKGIVIIAVFLEVCLLVCSSVFLLMRSLCLSVSPSLTVFNSFKKNPYCIKRFYCLCVPLFVHLCLCLSLCPPPPPPPVTPPQPSSVRLSVCLSLAHTLPLYTYICSIVVLIRVCPNPTVLEY